MAIIRRQISIINVRTVFTLALLKKAHSNYEKNPKLILHHQNQSFKVQTCTKNNQNERGSQTPQSNRHFLSSSRLALKQATEPWIICIGRCKFPRGFKPMKCYQLSPLVFRCFGINRAFAGPNPLSKLFMALKRFLVKVVKLFLTLTYRVVRSPKNVQMTKQFSFV